MKNSLSTLKEGDCTKSHYNVKYLKFLDKLLTKCKILSLNALINNNTTNKNQGWHAKKLLNYLGPTNSSCGYIQYIRCFMSLILTCYLAKTQRLYIQTIQILLYCTIKNETVENMVCSPSFHLTTQRMSMMRKEI